MSRQYGEDYGAAYDSESESDSESASDTEGVDESDSSESESESESESNEEGEIVEEKEKKTKKSKKSSKKADVSKKRKRSADVEKSKPARRVAKQQKTGVGAVAVKKSAPSHMDAIKANRSHVAQLSSMHKKLKNAKSITRQNFFNKVEGNVKSLVGKKHLDAGLTYSWMACLRARRVAKK